MIENINYEQAIQQLRDIQELLEFIQKDKDINRKNKSIKLEEIQTSIGKYTFRIVGKLFSGSVRIESGIAVDYKEDK